MGDAHCFRNFGVSCWLNKVLTLGWGAVVVVCVSVGSTEDVVF
jgi:hypothetical protein